MLTREVIEMFGEKIKSFGVVVGLLLVIAAGFLVLVPGEGEAVLAPTVTVALDQAEMTAYVAPGQKGVVTFTGTVHCSQVFDTATQKVIVTLEANAGGWAWSITPSTMAFDRQIKDAVFSVSVKVPPRTSHMITQQLTIQGRWYNSPGVLAGDVFPANAMVNVDQFYKFQVECTKPFIEVSPGDPFSFQLKIRNEGNDQDTIKIMVDGATDKKLNDMGWAVMLSTNEYIIDSGSEQNVKISITPAKEWHIWKNEVVTIKLRIQSYQALSLGEIPVETSYPLFVRERGYSAPGYELAGALFGILGLVMLMTFFSARKVRKSRVRSRTGRKK